MADKTNTNDSDPYVDIDPDFNNSVEVVERKESEDQVSLKKIIILLFLFIIIIAGGLAGVYYVFYGTSTEMIADNWHAPIVTTTTSTTIPQTIPSMSLVTTLPASMTLSVNQKSLTAGQQSLTSTGTRYSLTSYGANNAQPSLTTNISNAQVSLTALTMSAGRSLTELTLNTVSIETGLTENIKIVRKTINNPLAPLTPNLRSTPVLYRYKIASEMDEITDTTDEVALESESTDQPTDATETKAETASLTKTDNKESKEVVQAPLTNRRKPIVYRAAIPLILMYPELTLNFNSFILLLPEAETKTYVDISVSVKTSNEKVFKEIQDRKTFVRGAIYAILKRIFESNHGQYISGEDLKKKIIKDINYILINGTIDKVFITNYLTI
jgi:flagellar basal body-associated protein FliL